MTYFKKNRINSRVNSSLGIIGLMIFFASCGTAQNDRELGSKSNWNPTFAPKEKSSFTIHNSKPNVLELSNYPLRIIRDFDSNSIVHTVVANASTNSVLKSQFGSKNSVVHSKLPKIRKTLAKEINRIKLANPLKKVLGTISNYDKIPSRATDNRVKWVSVGALVTYLVAVFFLLYAADLVLFLDALIILSLLSMLLTLLNPDDYSSAPKATLMVFSGLALLGSYIAALVFYVDEIPFGFVAEMWLIVGTGVLLALLLIAYIEENS